MKGKKYSQIFLSVLFLLISMSLFSSGKCWKIVGWQSGGMIADAKYAVLVPVNCSMTEPGYGWYDVELSRAEIPTSDSFHLMISHSDPQMQYVDGEALVLEGIDDHQVPIVRYDNYKYAGQGYQVLVNTPPSSVMSSCVPYDNSITAWFPFDETTGNIAYNMFSSNHGYLENAPQHVPGKVDYALQLDGLNDYVEVAHHPGVDFGSGDFSIEAWIKTSDSYGNIVSKRHYHNSPGYLFMVYGSRLLLQMTDDISGWFNYYSYSSQTVNNNQWHHVAVTVDRDNPQGGKLYVDGVVVYTFNPTNRQGSLDTGANMWIGQEGGGGQYFNGIIDELSLYKKALDSIQINDIFLAGAYGKCKPAPLSVSLKVIKSRKKIRAVARPSGGSGDYSYTWHYSTNLKLMKVLTNRKRCRAIFNIVINSHQFAAQKEPAWVEVTVTDNVTMNSITRRKEFSLF